MPPKGGSRHPSDKMPVGKGMGLIQHYETLRMLGEENHGERETYATQSMVERLNRKFAWWDDPRTGGPTETCRSYLKELWRLGMADRIDADGGVIERSPDSWNKHHVGFRINDMGLAVMRHPPRCFPYMVAWCIVDTMNRGMHPQCQKLFELAKIETYIPVSIDETTRMSSLHGIRVEKHANKALKFGWLEPTGLIYRSSKARYKTNDKFRKWLERTPLEELFSNISADVSTSEVSAAVTPPYLGYVSFEHGRMYNIHIRLENKTDHPLAIKLECMPSAMIEHISVFKMDRAHILGPRQAKDVPVVLTSHSRGLGNSFGKMHLGRLRVSTRRGAHFAYLPTAVFAKRDRVWEMRVLEKLSDLQIYALHLGRSDRPDGVVDLSNLRGAPEDVLEYLRDGRREKLLVETTLGTYNWDKRISDTHTVDGESKFGRHTSRVLKIEAVGQLVVADAFPSDFDVIEERREHVVTFVTMDVLEYMVGKRNEMGDGHEAIRRLLLSNKKIGISDVNAAFERP